METKAEKISILMYPWLAHGHISPFFELAKKLSLKNFQIYLCSTQINLKAFRDSIHHDTDFPSIQLVDIELPSSFQELPPHYHTTKHAPPHLNSTLKTAFIQSKPAFCNILKIIKPDLVIFDFLSLWVPESAAELNIKAVLFLTCGAAGSIECFFTHNNRTRPSTEYPIKENDIIENEIQKLNLFMQDGTNGVGHPDGQRRSRSMVLIKTMRDIEAKYIDYLSDRFVHQEIVSVGSLVQEPAYQEHDEYIMNWMSKKGSRSVVYISFGSEILLSKEEMEEISNGLELIQANFIWVVRFQKGDNRSIHETLPQGFLSRFEEKGLVVEGWAPQAKILSHSSIGGFVSHCGWGSTMESMVFGVPIIAMPINNDQPINAKLVVELGVGIEVPRKDGNIDGKELARVINLVMAKEEGEQVKKKAKELSEKLKKKGDEELDVAVKKLLKLVKGI